MSSYSTLIEGVIPYLEKGAEYALENIKNILFTKPTTLKGCRRKNKVRTFIPTNQNNRMTENAV